MRVAKRICAFALALTIAFLSVGYEPPKANASLLASVGWSCAVSAYLNGIGLTMDATCGAAEDIAYDVREWHENTIMPIWEKYEKAIDATFDYATLIANGVNMSMLKQVRFSPELCSIFSEFAAWLISEFSLIGEDGEPVAEPVQLYSDYDYVIDGKPLIAPAGLSDYTAYAVPYSNTPYDISNAGGISINAASNGYVMVYWRAADADSISSTNVGTWSSKDVYTSDLGFTALRESLGVVFYAVKADGSLGSERITWKDAGIGIDFSASNVLAASLSPSYVGAPDVSEGKELVVALPADSDITTWEDFCTYVAQRDLEGVYTPEVVTVEDAQAGTTDGEDTEENTATLIGTTNGILDWTKKIWQSIKDIPKDIADMLTDAFVLSDEYAEALPQILTDTFAERTGFLTYPMSLLFGFVDLIATPAGDFILEWDDVYEPFSRGKLISAGEFNVTQYVNSNQALSNVYSLWKTVVSGYLIFMFFDLCYKKYNAIVRDRLG